MKSRLIIEQLHSSFEEIYDLLLLADPDLQKVKTYLQNGICYVVWLREQPIAAIVFERFKPTPEASSGEVFVEIKNIVVHPDHQRKGIGKQLLRYAIHLCLSANDEKIIIATGNSSIGQLALYQKIGFKISHVEKDYYLRHYSEPIFENGIQCTDRIVLRMELKQ